MPSTELPPRARTSWTYKNNCIDFQQKTPGAKWMVKIGSWSSSEKYLRTMTKEDWTKLCEVLSLTAGALGCLAEIGGCVGTETMTFGSVTLPCVWLSSILCQGHGAVSALLTTHCGEAVSMH